MTETIAVDVVSTEGQALQGSLTLPAGSRVRGGIIPLHPASEGSRDQFLFRHLAEIAPPLGVAVLRYDRRPAPGNVPLALQAQDALAAVDCLRERLGDEKRPIGLWGYSQGAWAAPLAAALCPEKVTFLILCASTGVTPAAQMRYGTARQLRSAGFGEEELAELLNLRAAVEEYVRGHMSRESAQQMVNRASLKPWFTSAWVPRTLPEAGSWADMDFEPEPVFRRVQCPVLLFYGEDDEWQPTEDSIATWRRATEWSGNTSVTIVRLPGTGHEPTLRDRNAVVVSPLYTETLASWIDENMGHF